jgi:flagellar protein FliO/FliZ
VTPAEPQFVAQLLGPTLFVIALIVLLAWLAKRMRWQPRSRDGRMEVIAEFAIGGRERILLLRVGDRQALIGLGAGSIVSLQLLDAPVAIEPGGAPAAALPFERVLRSWVGGRRP